jgi:SAM-dependent methyltransferase
LVTDAGRWIRLRRNDGARRSNLRSYSSESQGLRRFVQETAYLARARSIDIPARVAAALVAVREIESLVAERIGMTLQGLRMLDVGPGQLTLQSRYFSLENDVVGIDLDVIPRGFELRRYLDVLRENGWKRFTKTVGRKAMLVDLRYKHELERQLGVSHVREPRILRMDATAMTFPDASFDFVYSLVVLQNLREPAAALDEMIRVLKPGGGLYVDLTLFTSPYGSLDVRVLAGRNGNLPQWAHLVPETESQMQSNAFVSRLRLPEWRSLLEGRMPDVAIGLKQPGAEQLEQDARARWAQGELTDYTLEELVTNKVTAVWRKPALPL